MKQRSWAAFAAIIVVLSVLTGCGLTLATLFVLAPTDNDPVSSWVSLAAFLSMMSLPYILAATVIFAVPAMVLARRQRWDLSRDAVIALIAGAGMLAGPAVDILAGRIVGYRIFQGAQLWMPTFIGLLAGAVGGVAWWFLVARRYAASVLEPDIDGEAE